MSDELKSDDQAKGKQKYSWNALSALGGNMLEVRDGYAKAILPLSQEVMQPVSVYHAGAIVVLADEAASAAIWGSGFDLSNIPADKKFPYSVQLSVNLLTNDPVGPITAESKVLKRGRITVVDTEVFTHEGVLMTTMRSTHMMVDAKKLDPI